MGHLKEKFGEANWHVLPSEKRNEESEPFEGWLSVWKGERLRWHGNVERIA